jgi:hypothetical protein
MRTTIFTCTLLALAPLAASAADPISYTHVDVGYVTVDAGGGSVDGFGVEVDFAFDPAWYGLAAIGDVDGNTTLEIGGGWHTRVAPRTDLFFEGGLLSTDAAGGSDQGFIVGLGLRGLLSEAFELNGRVDLVDYGGGSDSQFAVGGVYYLERVGLFGEYRSDDQADAFMVGARFRF